MKKKSLIICMVATIFLFGGFGCRQQVTKFDTDLTVWGVFDNEIQYSEIVRAYTEAHPFINSVRYRKFTVESYKRDLLDALASGNNPDIFMIHNSWLPEFADKVSVAPPQIVTPEDVAQNFVDVASADMVIADDVYALAPSVDSLALYYNKDIFNAAGITAPPTTWDEFDTTVQDLSRRNSDDGTIIQSAATMGTSNNINRPMDILTVLMMQGGAQMTDGNSVVFDRSISNGTDTANPGRDALLYYTSFARGTSNLYTWNKIQHYSIDAFSEGKAAMTISYSYHYDTIKAKAEKLNFAVAPLPQIDNETLGRQVNFGNYWMYAVAKNRTIPEKASDAKFQVTNEMKMWESWQFLRALTMQGEGPFSIVSPLDGSELEIVLPFDFTVRYLETTGKPAARRDLIELQKDDARLGSFARGNLIARSWSRRNADAIDEVFVQMIDDVNRGEGIPKALSVGAQRARQLFQ